MRMGEKWKNMKEKYKIRLTTLKVAEEHGGVDDTHKMRYWPKNIEKDLRTDLESLNGTLPNF